MAMKLYGVGTYNVERGILPLFEAKLDAENELELVNVSLAEGQHKHPAYLKKQPFGTIPYFEDGDVAIYESRAIARYLAEKYQLTSLLGKTLKERAYINQWCEAEAHQFLAANLPMTKELYYSEALKRPPNEEIVKAGAANFNKVLDVYEAHFKEKKTKYLAGDRYTLADAFHAPQINYLLKKKPEFFESRPLVWAWVKDITSRPAFLKCHQLNWEKAKPLQ